MVTFATHRKHITLKMLDKYLYMDTYCRLLNVNKKLFISASVPARSASLTSKAASGAGLFPARIGVSHPPPGGVARSSFQQSLPASVSFCETRPACRDLGPQHNSLPPPWSLFTFPSQEKRNRCDTRLLMFLLSTCQSRGELSGSGSVNWTLIRCCSN